MAQGALSTIIESWETILATLLFLAIGAAIMFVSNSDSIKAKTLNNEISYISSIKGNQDFQIQIQTKDENTKINQNQNQITTQINEKKSSKTILGTQTKIEQNQNTITIS